jgi:uncharacterized protein
MAAPDSHVPPLPPEDEFEAAQEGPGTAEPEAEAWEDAPVAVEPDGVSDVPAEPDVEPVVPPEAAAEAPPPPGQEAPRRRAPRKAAKPRRPAAPEPPKLVLTPEQTEEAKAAAFARLAPKSSRGPERLKAALDLLEAGRSLAFIARFRRVETAGLDEAALRALRGEWEHVLEEERHRAGLKALLRERGGLTPERERALAEARSTFAMDDVAAPYLPVTASRATVARGMGLEPLAEQIRAAQPRSEPAAPAEGAPAPAGSELAALAQPFVKEGGEPATIDLALGGARDILAEELSLDAALRADLRVLFRDEGRLLVSVKPEKKTEVGRHGAVVGDLGPALRVPALKFLAVRRGERERVLSCHVEPPEERALALVNARACPEGHPHAGFLKAAAEDGYRRILKPLLQHEVRALLKQSADEHALESFERTLRNLLLAPIGGARRTLGVRPDVTMGHRWCAVDAQGLPAGCGQLPHEPTVGREPVLAELKDLLRTYEIEAVAVGQTGGKAEALALLREALGERASKIPLTVVHDGGVRAVEALPPYRAPDCPEVPSEQRGALSLARRFQDPLAELVTIDPRALALGPHMGDVHQGQLKRRLDEAVTSCAAYAGVDAERASADLLACLPGFTRSKAEAFAKARAEGGALTSKAALAAWEGVGPEAAEEAVGFLRLPRAADPRDRTQLHPEQYAIVDDMAAQLGLDVAAFARDPEQFAKLDLRALTTPERPLPLLHDVLFQLAEGTRDPRHRWAAPIPPPPGTTLATLRPGLVLEGRVTRVAPFGLFVDVGLETEGLLPVPHIGDHPGVDPATVAPLGAVIQVRVLEIVPEKRRLTLTMRSDARLPQREERGPRGPRRDDRGPRGPRREGRGPARERGPEAGVAAAAPTGAPPEGGVRRDRGDRRERPDRSGAGRGERREAGAGRPRQFSAAEGGGDRPRADRPARKPGTPSNAIGGAFGGRDEKRELGIFDRGIKDESGAPRRISLKAEVPSPETPDDEKALTPEQLLAKKLADLAAKFGKK